MIKIVVGRHVFANENHFPIYNSSNLGAVDDQDFFIWESGEKKIFLKEAKWIFAKFCHVVIQHPETHLQ